MLGNVFIMALGMLISVSPFVLLGTVLAVALGRRHFDRRQKVGVLLPAAMGMVGGVALFIASARVDGSDCTFDNFDCAANDYFFGGVTFFFLGTLTSSVILGVILLRRWRRKPKRAPAR